MCRIILGPQWRTKLKFYQWNSLYVLQLHNKLEEYQLFYVTCYTRNSSSSYSKLFDFLRRAKKVSN